MTTLIQPAELAAQIDDNANLVLLDVRWKLGSASGAAEFAAGHIPGARYADLDTELASHGEPQDGRHPLPSLEELQEAARGWGINDGDTVVVYDAQGNLAAARAWWLLRWGGLSDVRILDGALPAWTSAGYELATETEPAKPGNVTLTPDSLPVLDIDDVLDFSSEGVLLDARAIERYAGEVEPIDPKAGHIPGARSAPTGENLDESGRFWTAELLRGRFEELGVGPDTPVAVYCGSGVTAAHQIAALAIAGFEARLYPGSWSQWSNTDRPVETGR